MQLLERANPVATSKRVNCSRGDPPWDFKQSDLEPFPFGARLPEPLGPTLQPEAPILLPSSGVHQLLALGHERLGLLPLGDPGVLGEADFGEPSRWIGFFFRAKSSRIRGFGKRDGNKQGALPGASQSANQPVDRSPCFLRSTYGSLPMPRSPNGPSSAYLDGASAWQRVPMKTGTKPNNQQSTVCFLLMA